MSAQPKYRSARSTEIAIIATWKKLRRDLAHDPEELRASRLEFAAKVNGIGPIESLTELNAAQLGRVLDRLRQEEAGRPIANCGLRIADSRRQKPHRTYRARADNPQSAIRNPQSQVVHLASNSQVWAIERILDYLGRSDEWRAGFFRKNFKGVPARLLKTRQANSAITILLTMAASRDIKARLGEETKVSREMANEEMPALKKRIGLGTKTEEKCK